MEQMQARYSERLDEHDRDIKDLKADIRDLQKDIDSIKVNVTAVEKDIAIILNDGSHTRDALVEIKAESRDAWSKVEKSLEEIRKAREGDAYGHDFRTTFSDRGGDRDNMGGDCSLVSANKKLYKLD